MAVCRVKYSRYLISLLLFALFTQFLTGCSATNREPAVFFTSNLALEPKSPLTGALFSISLTVTNAGGRNGSYDAVLQITELLILENYKENILSTENFTKTVIVAAGQSENVTFDSLSLQRDGIYKATIEDLVKIFEVGC
jgi:hypothetical protein